MTAKKKRKKEKRQNISQNLFQGVNRKTKKTKKTKKWIFARLCSVSHKDSGK